MKGHSYKWKRKGLKHGNLQEYMEMESMSQEKDEHEQDLVMPGFRFHPTEEELIEFYLRRKVEGKRFNVELISLLDLYSYDPWELPAMGAIGEKEWFFYVPRDRKYRNGDRPNRVTTSGYWKATGADRMIRTENLRSIGLKKTLVFYTGKAPKGTRTSWIMNEYRLPHHETSRLQKISSKTHNAPLQAEISLCRVYKRTGVEDHYSSRPSSSATASSNSRRTELDKKSKNRQPSTSSPHLSNAVTTAFPPIERSLSTTSSSINQSSELLSKHRGWGAIDEDAILNQNSRQVPPFSFLPFFSSAPTSSTVVVDELNRLVELQQFYIQPNQFQPSHPLLNTLPNSLPPFPDNPWELNPMP